jgi:hypothetical protein
MILFALKIEEGGVKTGIYVSCRTTFQSKSLIDKYLIALGIKHCGTFM